jgi:acylphosphatase
MIRPMIRRRLVITGRVQGVFFRDWLVEQARSLGIDGWVRNRADGSVEAVVQGLEEMVDAIVAKARIGSPPSRVAGVAVTDDAPPETLDGFAKRPTL